MKRTTKQIIPLLEWVQEDPEILSIWNRLSNKAQQELSEIYAGELEKWLDFLTIRDTRAMRHFIEENPSFQAVYDCAIIANRDRKELMEIMSDFFENEDIIESLRLTNESRIKRLTKELKDKDRQLAEQKKQIASLQKKLEAIGK